MKPVRTPNHQPYGAQSVRDVTISMLTTALLQASAMISKYAYWFVCVLIFAACQKNLTPTSNITGITNQISDEHVEKVITIDSLERSVFKQTASLCISDSRLCIKIQDKVIDFYHGNGLKTKWMASDAPNELFYAFLNHLKNAGNYGLDPEAYRIEHIQQLVDTCYKNKSAEVNDIIAADIQISEVFFLFAIHLKEGRINESGYGDKIWIRSPLPADDSDVSMLLATQNVLDFDATIKALQPANNQYWKLQSMLILYRNLASSEKEDARVWMRAGLKIGNSDSAIPMIRKKLSLMNIGESATASISLMDSMYYDSSLASAVKKFQVRHGLEADGIIGDKTLIWVNQSFKEKADLIALNMERMRWSSVIDGAPCIRVNIPEYKLRVYEQNKETLQMNVIVGAVGNATPVFSTVLENVVFSPTWTVPSKIIKEEFVPRLKRDKMYYAERKNFIFYKKGMEIDPSTERWDSAFNVNNYRVVQQPGPDNALGLVKFAIRNDMNIYLHDTPDHRPFSRPYRALSHGCIRLDNPAKLAAHILQDDAAWDSKRIKKAMTSGQPQRTVATKQFHVHLEYNTVWVDADGNLNFREDIYGHDERQMKRLAAQSNPSTMVARIGR